MRKVWLTFDYELFLGLRSGTPEACLLHPTRLLLKQLQDLHICASFFVDASYLLRLRESSEIQNRRDLDLIGQQMRDLVRAGNRIELHLHPHWLDAEYSGQGQWQFPHYQHYCLHSLSAKANLELFAQGAQILLDLLKPEFPNYKLSAFRAGGLCAQPFESIRLGMQSIGLHIDSSVAPGLKSEGSARQYNYESLAAKVSGVYAFDQNPTEPSSGDFKELPILCYGQNIFQKLHIQFLEKTEQLQGQFGDGIGIADRNHSRTWQQKINKTFNPWTLDFAKRKSWQAKWNLTHGEGALLCHPKNLNSTSFELLNGLGGQSSLQFLTTIDL